MLAYACLSLLELQVEGCPVASHKCHRVAGYGRTIKYGCGEMKLDIYFMTQVKYPLQTPEHRCSLCTSQLVRR